MTQTVDITDVLNAVLALCAALVTSFALPWLKRRISSEGLATLQFWVCAAVRAAEQYFGSGEGQAKKQYVLNTLREKGIAVDDAVIEGAVNALFGKSGSPKSDDGSSATEQNAQKGGF